MRVVVAVAHDREAGHALADAREQHVGVGREDARGDSFRRPAPAQSVFDQVSRHGGDGRRFMRPRQT